MTTILVIIIINKIVIYNILYNWIKIFVYAYNTIVTTKRRLRCFLWKEEVKYPKVNKTDESITLLYYFYQSNWYWTLKSYIVVSHLSNLNMLTNERTRLLKCDRLINLFLYSNTICYRPLHFIISYLRYNWQNIILVFVCNICR